MQLTKILLHKFIISHKRITINDETSTSNNEFFQQASFVGTRSSVEMYKDLRKFYLATLEVDAGLACDGQCCTCCSNGVS
jgi:hypothetical protein